MSDGLSDTSQDDLLVIELNNLTEEDSAFFRGYDRMSENSRIENGIGLIKKWRNYTNMRGGLTAVPASSIAFGRILTHGRLLEGKVGIAEVRKQYEPDKRVSDDFYFAVMGHGMLMGGNFEGDFLRTALKTKFGEVPHSFRAVITEQGMIDFEKVSCKDCAFVNRCSIQGACNMYNAGEFAERKNSIRNNREEAIGYVSKYAPGNGGDN